MIWTNAPSTFHLVNHQIDVYRHNLNVSAEQLKCDEQLLNDKECEKANQFHFPKHRRRYISAKAALRKLLAYYIDIPAQNIVFNYSAHGKPELANNPQQIQFNLSHSGEMAVYAITREHQIGIDIEHYKTRRFLSLAKRYFAPDEYQQIANLPTNQQYSAFFQVWVQKEAFVKALGLGLSYDLASFSVSVAPPARLQRLADGDINTWSLSYIPVESPFYCALATQQIIKTMQFFKFSG